MLRRRSRIAAPISLQDMGSLCFGGRVQTRDDGDTFHGDHGYAQYFTPEHPRRLALVLWHGLGQSGKAWECAPDGREGFWQIFLRRRWQVVIVDQPRRGRAGRALPEDEIDSEDGSAAVPMMERESAAWMAFRLGVWKPPAARSFFPGLCFPADERSVDQFLHQQAPNTGPEPFPDAEHRDFLGGSVADLVDEVGECILITHSHSGQYGWVTAMKQPDRVRAVVALEPGTFAFPDDGIPPDVPTTVDALRPLMAPQVVPAEEFDALTRIPILILWGDNIAAEPSDDFNVDLWRVSRARARQFAATINERGGDAVCVELPEHGITGNSHFLMGDLNNVEVADVISAFLAERGLDATDHDPQAITA